MYMYYCIETSFEWSEGRDQNTPLRIDELEKNKVRTCRICTDCHVTNFNNDHSNSEPQTSQVPSLRGLVN